MSTNAELMDDQEQSFAKMATFIKGVIKGSYKGLVLTGSGGMGKSYAARALLTEAFPVGEDTKWTQTKSRLTPIQLFKIAYQYREGIIVIDDADTLLDKADGRNLIKSLTDSTNPRWVGWNTMKTLKDDDGEEIPKNFIFEGRIIFISNISLDGLANNTTEKGRHIAAILDRVPYMNIEFNTPQEKLTRIECIYRRGSLFLDTDLSRSRQEEVMTFVRTHAGRFKSLSLRTPIKIAQHMEASPDKWQLLAVEDFKKSKRITPTLTKSKVTPLRPVPVS